MQPPFKSSYHPSTGLTFRKSRISSDILIISGDKTTIGRITFGKEKLSPVGLYTWRLDILSGKSNLVPVTGWADNHKSAIFQVNAAWRKFMKITGLEPIPRKSVPSL